MLLVIVSLLPVSTKVTQCCAHRCVKCWLFSGRTLQKMLRKYDISTRKLGNYDVSHVCGLWRVVLAQALAIEKTLNLWGHNIHQVHKYQLRTILFTMGPPYTQARQIKLLPFSVGGRGLALQAWILCPILVYRPFFTKFINVNIWPVNIGEIKDPHSMLINP